MDEISELLETAQTIAVVGLSNRLDRPSHRVADYMKQAGYHIIPVNPTIKQWEGIPAVASLADITEPVDIVDVFRRPEYTTEVVEEAIRIGAKAVWLQLGITNDVAAEMARKAGLSFIQNRCIAVEHAHRLPEIGAEGAW